jgi:hypothetical protein
MIPKLVVGAWQSLSICPSDPQFTHTSRAAKARRRRFLYWGDRNPGGCSRLVFRDMLPVYGYVTLSSQNIQAEGRWLLDCWGGHFFL